MRPSISGLRGKVVLVMAGMLGLVLIFVIYINEWQTKRIAMQVEQSKLTLLASQLESDLKSHRNNLLSLHDVPPIQAILSAKNHDGIDPDSGDSIQQWRQRLNVIFKAFLSNHSNYYQLRYIDRYGMEMVRAERDQRGLVHEVAEADLQDKSALPYVQETLKLADGEIYYSDVDLNREHGEIEMPYVPVFRLATPIYHQGELAGLLSINLYADSLFATFEKNVYGEHFYVTNQDGYFLISDNPAHLFGFDLGNDFRLRNMEPELAALAHEHDQWVSFHEEHREVDGFHKIYFSPYERERYWLLGVHTPATQIFGEIREMRLKMLMLSLFIALIVLIPAYLLVSRKIVKPLVILSTATRQLREGDLSVRVDPDLAEDEFRTLYDALNGFADNQQHSTRRLEAEVSFQTRKMAAVIDHIIDGVITISEAGEILSFNPSAIKIFGYSEQEVIGQNVKMLMPEPYRGEHDGYLAHHNMTGEKRVIGIGREVRGLRKDGSEFPLDLAINELVVDGARIYVGIIRDITDRKAFEQRILNEKNQLEAVINTAIDAIIMISDQGMIESFNPAARRLFGYVDAEVLGKNIKMLMPQPYQSEHDGYLQRYLDRGERHVIGVGREAEGQRKDGSTFPIELSVSEVFINQKCHFVGMIHDISVRRQHENKIRQMAHYDHLTELPNRALFTDRLHGALELAQRNHVKIALMFIDLDGFKAVNDSLGHESGDELLKQVSKRLLGCVRRVDTVARLGGDEFAVILSDVKDRENVAEKAIDIIDSVSAPYPSMKGNRIGCSIGIALFPDDAANQKQLLSRADTAMYAVKADGKNHYRFYDIEEMKGESTEGGGI